MADSLALDPDPLTSLALSGRVLEGATAGAALCQDGTPRGLPGLGGDRLLVEGSPVLALSVAYLTDGQAFITFVWPREESGAPGEYVRVTVLAGPSGASEDRLGAIVLAPAADLHGLTPRELNVLGLVIEGLSNQQIARALAITRHTVATHLEHVLAKLGAPTRTVAAVRAERRGLYVPSPPDG